MKRLMKDYWILFLKGVGMGSADIIPGVSGGTVAFVTGIYEELLDSLQSFDIVALKLLLAGQWKALWRHINGAFLLTLVAGIATSLLTSVRLMSYVLHYYPIQSWSFFFGLVLVSSSMIYRQIQRWDLLTCAVSLVGVYLAYVTVRGGTDADHSSRVVYCPGRGGGFLCDDSSGNFRKPGIAVTG